MLGDLILERSGRSTRSDMFLRRVQLSKILFLHLDRIMAVTAEIRDLAIRQQISWLISKVLRIHVNLSKLTKQGKVA